MTTGTRGYLLAAMPIVVLSALVVSVSEGVASVSGILAHTTTLALVTMVAVIGVYMFTGNSGIVSFGHMGFMLVGAYVSGLLSVPVGLKHVVLPHLPAWLAAAHVDSVVATLVAGLAGALLALILAPSLMRLAGLAASIATFALLVIIQVVASQLDDVTGGYGTFVGVPIDTTLEVALIWVIIAILCAYLFQQSSFGIRLRASREDPVASAALGVSVVRMRAVAFVLSAFFVAVAGSLYGHAVSAFSTNAFYVDETFVVIAMLVVGGLRSLAGAVVGPIVITVVTELLRQVENGITVGGTTIAGPVGLTQVGLAVVILIVLILRPSGVMGDGEHEWVMRLSRRVGRFVAPSTMSTTPSEATAPDSASAESVQPR